MPVRMTEITPQLPSGAAKISAEIGDVVAKIDFDAELELAEGVPVEVTPESREFTLIGRIIRKMVPLEVQMHEDTAQPPSIDVELAAEKPAIVEATHDQIQQISIAETKMPMDTISTVKSAREPKEIDNIPLGLVISTQMPSPSPIANVTENPSTQPMPLVSKIQRGPQLVESSGDPIPARNIEPKHVLTHPNNNAVQSIMPDSPDFVSDTSPESKLRTIVAVQNDFNDFGAGISDKPPGQRPSQSAVPVAPHGTTRPQAAEGKIISQISTAISNTSKDTVEIRLDPPELGRVIISITQTDSGLSATVTSEKAEVADLLRRHAELLSRELSKSGFSETSLEFSHRDGQHDQPILKRDKTKFSSLAPEQAEVTSAIEAVLRSHSGSLDIRL